MRRMNRKYSDEIRAAGEVLSNLPLCSVVVKQNYARDQRSKAQRSHIFVPDNVIVRCC